MYSYPIPRTYYAGDNTSEEEEEQEVDPSDLSTLTSWKQNLGRTINAIETFGDVAWSKSFQNIVLPGLRVGGTPISLPLTTPRDIDVIRNACDQASSDHGDERVADEAVKKTWAIGRGGFSFSNPNWPNFVDGLLEEASWDRRPQGVRAELDKLVLYEPGSSFMPHMKSEKAPGTIAALAICLPTAHKGGDVHLSHSGQAKVLVTSHASAFEVTTLAWYSDVTYEVKEITSGHRVVAMYNVVLAGVQTNEASAVGILQQQAKLESILGHGHAHYENATRLFYQLSNKYRGSTLSLDGLKGHDRARVHALQKSCASCGYVLLLANVTKTRTEYEEKNQYLDNELYRLDYVAACDGSVVGLGGEFDPKSFIGSKPYHNDRDADSVDRDERNYTEPTGYSYHDSRLANANYAGSLQAAVIVRKDDLPIFLNFKYLSKDNIARNVAKLITTVFYNPGDPPVHNEAFEHLRQLMGMAITDSARTNTLSHFYGGHPYPFGGDSYGQAPPKDSWDMGSLGPVLSRLALHLDQDSMGGLEEDWDKHLGKLITSLPDMEKVEKALDRIGNAINRSDTRESLQAWRNSLADARFNIRRLDLAASDCLMIITLLQSGKDLDWIHECLLPALKNGTSKSIILALVPSLLSSTGIEGKEAMAKVILDGTMERLELDASDLASTVEHGPITDPTRPRWSTLDSASDYDNSQVASFMKLVKACSASGFTEESSTLLDTCCRNVAELHEVQERWAEFFLKDILDTLKQVGGPAPPSFKPLFERLIRHYVLAGIPGYPAKPVGWAHKRRECPDSASLAGVHDRADASLSAGWGFRKHIESQLQPQHFRCHTTKSGAPHTLVVTKMGTEYQVEEAKHMRDIMKLDKRLEPYRDSSVYQSLGDELYNEIVMLEKLRLAPSERESAMPLEYGAAGASALGIPAQGSGNKRPASGFLEQPVASKMRMSGVIDLTEDN
ncbi:hypothetical protein PG988_011026 [Apiospora saccharicola]